MRISVIICSVGRPEAIESVLPFIARQTKQPSHVLIVVTKPEDLPSESALQYNLPIQILYSPKGLTKQRNTGLDAVQSECDAVFFIDDDFLPAQDALAVLESGFTKFPEAGGLTGSPLADGINSSGVEVAAAREMIETYEASVTDSEAVVAQRNLIGLYGCNMAYRCSAIGTDRFDPRLPLYGWQEDTDFSSRLKGEKIKLKNLTGVHCGTKSGRETSGVLLGYSQIANPVYLMRKKSLPVLYGFYLMGKNVLANHGKILFPEPWINRKERAKGNWVAFFDVLRGRDAPERILDLMARRS